MGMMRKTVGERGEIVAVEGGHIVRSTGRKDRHSKVYTSKGPRDRRVRLAAHTAIQFYDVQDRLGYDRPSKAVDWLIKKAKSAIDKLDELPPFYPNVVGSTDIVIEPQQQSDDSYFPTNSSNLSLNFENYPHHMVPHSDKSQDLCLSLQSYQDQNRNIGNLNATEQTLFGTGWDDNGQNEVNRFSRMLGWNNGGEEGENRGGFLFGLAHSHQQLMSSSSQIGSDFATQRGTLQSSFVAPVRAWDDHEMPEIHRGSIAGDRYASEGFSMFGIPTRFHGNEEDNDPTSSVSPNSHQ